MTLLRENPELLRAFREGRRDALERVYWEYVDVVAKVVRFGMSSLHGRIPGVWNDEASEIVQETFVRAFTETARLAYDGLRDYRPYLLTICRHLIIDYARKRGREVLTGDDWEIEANTMDSEENWADSQTMKLVQDYISSLPEELKSVYEQRYQLGNSQERSAERLSVSRQRIRTLENRLRRGLRKTLKQKGGLSE